MLKTISKYAHVVLALSLTLSLASGTADARPASPSFKSGFSSQRSSSSSSSSKASSSKPSGSFGSFSRRSADTAPASNARQSDSALSRKMDQERSQANALRTLDERRAAQAARENAAARPAPGTGQPAGGYADERRAPPQGYGYGPAQAPIIVNQNGGGGLGHVVAGAILARSAANAHANNNNGGGYYPPGGATGGLADKAGAGSVGSVGGNGATAAPSGGSGSVLGAIARTLVWLGVLALVAWGVWFLLKRRKARRDADKPNYSFERN